MQYKAVNADDYISQIPEERQGAMKKLRTVIKKNLPNGFKEGAGHGMMGWSVLHSKYPQVIIASRKIHYLLWGLHHSKISSRCIIWEFMQYHHCTNGLLQSMQRHHRRNLIWVRAALDTKSLKIFRIAWSANWHQRLPLMSGLKCMKKIWSVYPHSL